MPNDNFQINFILFIQYKHKQEKTTLPIFVNIY